MGERGMKTMVLTALIAIAQMRGTCIARMAISTETGKKYSGGGSINDGQIISMIADLDKGTLRFWLDGQPYGPGWSSGVKGKLRWSVSVCEDAAVQIVPTPELQPWTEWDGTTADDMGRSR